MWCFPSEGSSQRVGDKAHLPLRSLQAETKQIASRTWEPMCVAFVRLSSRYRVRLAYLPFRTGLVAFYDVRMVNPSERTCSVFLPGRAGKTNQFQLSLGYAFASRAVRVPLTTFVSRRFRSERLGVLFANFVFSWDSQVRVVIKEKRERRERERRRGREDQVVPLETGFPLVVGGAWVLYPGTGLPAVGPFFRGPRSYVNEVHTRRRASSPAPRALCPASWAKLRLSHVPPWPPSPPTPGSPASTDPQQSIISHPRHRPRRDH